MYAAAGRSELQGVRQQVGKHPFDLHAIHFGRAFQRQIGGKLDAGALGRYLELLHDVAHHRRQIQPRLLQRELSGLGLRKQQQGAHDLRLSQIVRALLLLSQAESGQLALQKTRLDLSAVVRDIVEQFQIPAEGARIELSSDLPLECAAEVDRVQIERMLSNLLSNALKFTPAGGRVHVALRSLPDAIEIDVEDTGCGIPEEHIPHIFERFYRVPAQETCENPEPGLGLGLSFVAWIAKAHGGTIRVESAPGRGTRFSVLLPAAVAEPAPPDPVATGAAAGPHWNE